MIVEVASIRVKEGLEAEFEAAVGKAVDVFRRADGCLGLVLTRCVEDQSHYDVVIRWKTLEDHTVGFRGSPLFAEWRALVGPFFAEPPSVKHYANIFPPVEF
ncbi:antibiotic biosynthesis monooxygenase family protein [Mesorhizobium australicum]|uniref:Heme-degrading monooxygenase HmoA n=1 Tax=Mesorhizobium australicum TaxID=536018 RepID=A0A1X7NLE0_9HYPH|nr:antibiotic biosynthesis monooxygenase family protein [Mesorhizobium australicum]SMH38317.1 Heme-degrading monooxygenase HmoA [Mesorhizobium australicum]